MAKGARGISAVAISKDKKYVVLCDMHDDHNVYVYDTDSGSVVYKDKGGQNKILDVAFDESSGSHKFATVGSKHCEFWDVDTQTHNRGLLEGAPNSSFACVAWDSNGLCYTGGADGKIYVW